MAISDSRHNSARKVKVVEQFRYKTSVLASVTTTSQDLATLLGSTIPTDVAYIEIVAEGDVHINFWSPATTSNGKILANSALLVAGEKEFLETVELIASATTAVSLFVITTDTDYQGA